MFIFGNEAQKGGSSAGSLAGYLRIADRNSKYAVIAGEHEGKPGSRAFEYSIDNLHISGTDIL